MGWQKIWKVNRGSLSVFALNTEGELNESTPLCNAPYFNVYNDGKVCLGNVSINLPGNCGLEEFMKLWQIYFLNSYFSHTLTSNAVNGNIVQLWQTDRQRNALPFGQVNPVEIHLKRPEQMKTLTAVHFTDNNLLNPTNPITDNIIGAGGTGHRTLTELLRMHTSLIALGSPGHQVNLFALAAAFSFFVFDIPIVEIYFLASSELLRNFPFNTDSANDRRISLASGFDVPCQNSNVNF